MRFLAVILLVVFIVDKQDTASVKKQGHGDVICGSKYIAPMLMSNDSVCCAYNVRPRLGKAYTCYYTLTGRCRNVA